MSSFTLSDTVIVVICGAGVILVFSIVVCLIMCITSKKKDHVRVIRLPRRPRSASNHDTRPRRIEYPKPPPYSELPPEYTDSPRETNTIYRETTQTRPASTRAVNVSIHRTSSMRTRHGSPHPNLSARDRNNIERDGSSHQNTNRNNVNIPRNETFNDHSIRRNRGQTSRVNDSHSNTLHVTQNVDQMRQPTSHSNQAIILNPVQSSSNSFQTRNRHVTNPPSNLLPGEVGSGISPPPTTRAGEIRSAQRRQAIATIENRRMQRIAASPPPAYEQIVAI